MKDIKYCFLLQTYGKLLTATQGEIAEMYYNYDMSLSEIAEIKGVSRQSVSDALKKVRAELDEFEVKLGFLAKKQELKEFAKGLSQKEQEAVNAILER